MRSSSSKSELMAAIDRVSSVPNGRISQTHSSGSVSGPRLSSCQSSSGTPVDPLYETAPRVGHDESVNTLCEPSPPTLSDATRTIELLPGLLGPASVDSFERVLWWLFAGSAGATTRAQVLRAIRDQPRNAQQLSEFLRLDYTTVRHHLRVLEANRLVLTEGDKYGKLYFISDLMESHWEKLENILQKSRREKRRVE